MSEIRTVTLETEFGSIMIWSKEEYWSGGESVHIRYAGGSPEAEVVSPDQLEDPHDASLSLDDRIISVEHRGIIKTLQFGLHLIEMINHANAEAVALQKHIERCEEEARILQEQERQRLVEERTEMLMHELVGERVKVRHRHYKTMCYATVEVRGNEDSGYRPWLRYSDQGQTRDFGVDSFQRLDVRTEDGWRTVWDDGKEDLSEHDRGVRLPRFKAYSP